MRDSKESIDFWNNVICIEGYETSEINVVCAWASASGVGSFILSLLIEIGKEGTSGSGGIGGSRWPHSLIQIGEVNFFL